MNVKDGRMRAALTRRVRADATRRSTRRAFLLAVAAWPALACAGAARAQAPARVRRIGLLSAFSPSDTALWHQAFRLGLRDLGWVEGKNLSIEYRYAEGRRDRLPDLAADLVRLKVDVIVASVTTDALAAQKATRAIPIVMVVASDPVAIGLVESLAQPGGMVIGLTNIASELSAKYLELLLAAAPKLMRIGFLVDRHSPGYAAHMGNARSAITHYRVEARFAELAKAEELEPAMARLAKEGAQGLVVLPSTWLAVERARIVKLALAHRWPVIAAGSNFVEEGALLSYATNTAALFCRAAWYVDQILKGAKPGDLPIEQPTKFELVVNMKTAKVLGITIPQTLMLQADKVIE